MRVLKPASFVLILLILAKFVIQYLVVHPAYDLQRDEYLHLDQANHLAWGYASVPPVTSWISWMILRLGNGEFWVRFFPALFGALTIVVVWETTRRLGGKLFALTAAAVAILFSSLLRLNMLFQPNSLEILCWTTFFYLIIVYIQTEKPKWLYIAAIVFAIGFLNKYNIVFMVAGLIPAILIVPQRKLFLNKHLMGAAVLALLLISPNLIWQWQNNFPVFRHLEELATTQLLHVRRSDFLIDQVFFFIGSILVLIAAWVSLFKYPPFRLYHFFLLSFLFTMLIFVYFKAKSYYAIGLYPIYMAFGAVYIEKIFETGWKRWLRVLAIALPVLFFIPMLKRSFPLKEPNQLIEDARKEGLDKHRWEDGKEYPISQDFADMLGWRELAIKTESLFFKINKEKSTIVICDNYGEAGAINYYKATEAFRAQSFNADYLIWLDEELKKSNIEYSDMIFVRQPGRDAPAEAHQAFENIVVVDSITHPWARELGTRIFWFKNAKVNLREYLQTIVTSQLNEAKTGKRKEENQ